jgi:hypothetical protein
LRIGLHQQRGNGGEQRKATDERRICRRFGDAEAAILMRRQAGALEQQPDLVEKVLWGPDLEIVARVIIIVR